MKSRNFGKTAFFVLAVFISGCGRRTEPPLTRQADLVICTDLELPVYEPVVKEFEERTGLTVKCRREHRKRSGPGLRRNRQSETEMESPDRISRQNGIWPLV